MAVNKDRALLKRLQEWREDPVMFVRDVFAAEPTTQQKKVMRAVAKPGSKVAVAAGHGVGKSCLMAWLSIWHVYLFDPCTVGATAPSSRQLHDVLMKEIGAWLNRAAPIVRDKLEWTTSSLFVKGEKKAQQYLTAKTAKPEDPSSLQGLHSENFMFLIDEAFGVADPIYEVIGGALTEEGSRTLLCGNPTTTSGYAFECFHKNRDAWECFHLSCLESPRVGDKYELDMANTYGRESDVYRVRVLGQFPQASEAQFIPSNWVDAARDKTLGRPDYDWSAKILGVDVARFGGDRSVVAFRQGLHSEILFHEMKTHNLMDLCDKIAAIANKPVADGGIGGVDAIFVDDVGVGSGVTDRLRHMFDGNRVIPVNFSNKASEPNRFHNKRAECWGKMKDWLERGASIPAPPSLGAEEMRKDLVGPEYKITESGKIQLEKKDSMKRRGLDSPDFADAMALTFAYPVASPNEREQIQRQRNTNKRRSLLGKWSGRK